MVKIDKYTKSVYNNIGGDVMSIKEIRLTTGMNRKQFAEYFGIPYRTVEDWESGKAKCSEYLMELIVYKLKKEGLYE